MINGHDGYDATRPRGRYGPETSTSGNRLGGSSQPRHHGGSDNGLDDDDDYYGTGDNNAGGDNDYQVGEYGDLEIGETLGLKTVLLAGRDDSFAAYSAYLQQVITGGYLIETRVQTDTKVVVVMPACKLTARAKTDELTSGGKETFELRVVAGAELVTACRNPISKCTESVVCTCPEFRLALTRAQIVAGPGAASSNPRLEANCVHTMIFRANYAPVHFPSSQCGTPATTTGTADELAHRISMGRIQPGDIVDDVTEFQGKASVTQVFSVVDARAIDHLTAMSMPTVAIVTSTPRFKAGSNATEYVLECRSKICGKRASATLPKAAAGVVTPGGPQVNLLAAQDGGNVCRHIKKVYDSATRENGITLVDNRSASAQSAGKESEFDEGSGLYTHHQNSFFWKNRPKNMPAEHHCLLSVQDIRDFIKDPRLNLPKTVSNLTNALEHYKSVSFSYAGQNAPSVYPGDNEGVKITLTSNGVFVGPKLIVKCGNVCTEEGCTGQIGDPVPEQGVPDSTVVLYSLVGAFACKTFARQCGSCNTWYKFTGHGTGMLRQTKQTAFSLDLFLEHTERTRASFGSQTFTQFGNTVSRAYAWSGLVPDGLVPDAFDRVPDTVHKFGQTSLFIEFWLTVCSASQFHYPTAVPCPAHGVAVMNLLLMVQRWVHQTDSCLVPVVFTHPPDPVMSLTKNSVVAGSTGRF